MVNIIRFAKKNIYKSILLGGSFYKLSAMNNFEIKKCSIEKGINNIFDKQNINKNSINDIDIDNKIKEEYYEVKINKNVVFPFNGSDFRKKYGSYLNENSKFLYDDNFLFFSTFNNLSLIYDVLNDVNVKIFNCLPKIYSNGLTIFNELIKLYRADESAKLNYVSFPSYVNENTSDLIKKIKSSTSIKEDYFIYSWNCMVDFFSAFKKYFFVGNIGKGGFGFVLECIKGKIDKEYNEKQILTFSGSYACKFTLNNLLEKELVPSSFNHKNIVKILGFHQLYPLGYVLMPKYAGDLVNFANNFYNQFPEQRDYKILNSISFQIFDVLKYLRENKYFHNDIKLDNFLLDSDRNVILTDFSLGYKIDVDYSTKYDNCTLLFCSKHNLNKFVNIKAYNHNHLLEIYEKNKSIFLNSEVFKNNSLSESDFEKLDEDKKYQFLINSVKELKDKISFKERNICIADICDIRTSIEPSTSIVESIDVNGIKYPKSALCRDNLYKSDYYAAALVINFLFNGCPNLYGFEITDILEHYKNNTLKIDYSNKDMDSKLRLMLSLIADDNFFSSADSLKNFDKVVKFYDDSLKTEKNKKNRKNSVKKRSFNNFKKLYTSVKKIDPKLLENHPNSFLDYIK